MICPKCNKLMKMLYKIEPDGRFYIVWYCKGCKLEKFTNKRHC